MRFWWAMILGVGSHCVVLLKVRDELRYGLYSAKLVAAVFCFFQSAFTSCCE